MATLVIDENLPRSLAPALAKLGHNAKDVRDHGLRGKPDEIIFAFVQQEQAILVSGDVGFANLTRFPLGTHQGIRLPNELSADRRIQEIVKVFESLKNVALTGVLVVVSPGRVRIRRKP